MTTEKYINTYTHSNLSPDEIRGMMRDLDDPGLTITRDEKQMKREALEKVLRKTLAAVRLIIVLFMCMPATAQTLADGDILVESEPYWIEIYDYDKEQWDWINWTQFEFGRFSFYVRPMTTTTWRVITCGCSDTTYYSIYGAPERTKIDTAVPADGGHHTIGVNPNPIIE
jgi:hypothetical protein